MNNALILIDGSWCLYRAFHAVPPLLTAAGQPINAIFGMTAMLRKLIANYQPKQIAVIFDSKEKNFRHQLFPAYKAHRLTMPVELQAQITPLQAIIRAMGISVHVVAGVEADDVIGTLAMRANQPVVIVTGDKDMAQLVNQDINLFNTMTNTRLNIHTVKQKFGVSPGQIIDYLMLLGDKSDNIDGVPGIGTKTAVKLLARYENIDNILANLSEIPGKISAQLAKSQQHFALTRELLTIRCHVDLPNETRDLSRRAVDQQQLKTLLQTLEFKSWLHELEKSPLLASSIDQKETAKPRQAQPIAAEDNHYITITEQSALTELIVKLQQVPLFAFDTETTSLTIHDAQIVGLSFALISNEAYYLPLGHDYLGAPEQLNRQSVLQQLKPILENSAISKVGQNLKYDMQILRNVGIHLAGIAYDTMLESYVLNSTATRHDMDSLAQQYLGKNTTTYEMVGGKGAKQLTFNQVDIATATNYAAEDAAITWQLHEYLWPKLQKNMGLVKTFNTVEMPLVPVLAAMEYRGVLIDADLLQAQSTALAQRILTLEEQAYELAGQHFNLASPKQLQTILYEQLNLPVLEKTPSGQPATGESVLQALAEQHALPKVLLAHRTLSKLKSTYTDKLPLQIHPRTRRIHTSYHQAVAATGRLSSSNPNLQNIPIRTEEGRQIRQAFIAPKGYQIVSADYSQIELRIMAHLSQDPALLSAFNAAEDVHRATAAEIFNIHLDQVTAEQRRYAKTTNFGLIYGMSSFGLAKQLGIETADAKNFINTYFARYPGVKKYMNDTRKLAHQQGYVTTIVGRQLHLPDIHSRHSMRLKAAERAAINAPLQGSAADLIKLAMIALHHGLMAQQLPATMIMQVHDELIFEVADTAIDQVTTYICETMEQVLSLAVPLRVDIGVGMNWDEAH